MLENRSLSYETPGCTSPATSEWQPPSGFRIFERTVQIGLGDAAWTKTRTELIRWAVKTRSGFMIRYDDGAQELAAGQNIWLVAVLGPLRIREPIRVVEFVDTSVRCGYAYGTLDGHPITGEEAFIVHRKGEAVMLTIRSVTRPGSGLWRVLFPAVLLGQRVYRKRYLRALSSVER